MNILVVFPTDKLQSLVDILSELYPDAQIATDYDGMGGVQYAFNHPVDMVYTGLRVKPLNGFDVARLVWKVHPQAEVSLIADTQAYLKRAAEANFSGYFIEPIDRDTLLHGNILTDYTANRTATRGERIGGMRG